MSRAFAALQRLLPQHGMSRLAGQLANSETVWLKHQLITNFARAYNVDMADAIQPSLDAYPSFNAFFTRALRPDARPLAADPQALLCPADGTVSQAGTIEKSTLLQAKGQRYSLATLAGESYPTFDGGTFATIYLAPSDYHRVHLPLTGALTRTRAIPGALFSVNTHTEASVGNLFARNERLVCHFDTDHGRMLVVLVGALIVASIETVWEGPESPYQRETVQDYRADAETQEQQVYERGAEIGRFLLGSTVIVCLEKKRATLLPHLVPGTTVQMGEAIATVTTGE